MGKIDKRHEVPLPGKDSPDYFRTLVRNCISTFAIVYNDRTALDYNKVTGTMRALVLDDEEYRQETRSLRAKRIIEGVEELEELGDLAAGMGEDVETDDPWEKGKKKKISSVDKDMLSMRFKALQTLREALNLDAQKEETEEADALNLFFIPVTKEEFERLGTIEAHEGTSDGSQALAEEAANSLPDAKAVAEKLQNIGAAETLPYITNEDGSIEEI